MPPRGAAGHHVDHDHHHDHAPGAGHDHPASGWRGLLHALEDLVRPHSHEGLERTDAAMETSREGMRVIWISLAALGVTAALQAVVVVLSGSVALLGDTLHNAVDALTAVPLGIAFTVGRRAATRRYTYGYGRAEDLAGIVIVALIALSSLLAGFEAIRRLAHPQPVSHLWAVAAAGVIGFLGNELVARYRIRVGQRIGSAALMADGLHARTDGFTSLAVVLGAGGVAMGWQLADPIIGLLITVAIALVLRDAAREVYRRLMDAVDPQLVATAETVLQSVPGVLDVGQLRMRWIGHELHADADVVLDPELSLGEAHQLTVHAERELTQALPRLGGAVIHADPHTHRGREHHV
ncbi:cation diffusion facilitator family transporter [Oryzihumus sp.]|uniref:cation diffusion facilitator family transporter n=1 Tax=Oryzihumus sp. TaxID=1968903 RepID=UPI002ED9401A